MDDENALLGSGIALAGFNRRDDGGDNDGILSAFEVSGLNLHGTKLVTLSAYDTGLGEVTEGEGVYGLRRAFELAGAENVVMSLWSVDDVATKRLMTRVLRQRAAWRDASAGTHERAARSLRVPAYQHPYYWAAFIVSGTATAIYPSVR